MKAELGDDPFDGASADGLPGLTQLLAEDGGRGVGIQKAIADDLLDDLVGAAVVGFGAALLVLEGEGTALFEGLAQLEVALLGVAELAGGGQGAEAFALAFVEQGEFGEDGVVGGDGQLARWADEDQRVFSDLEHRCQDKRQREGSPIKYGGHNRPIPRLTANNCQTSRVG